MVKLLSQNGKSREILISRMMLSFVMRSEIFFSYASLNIFSENCRLCSCELRRRGEETGMRFKRPNHFAQWLLLILLGACSVRSLHSFSTWSYDTGERIAGDFVSFDKEAKAALFRDPVSKSDFSVPGQDLALASRQSLLVRSLEIGKKKGHYDDEEDEYTREARERRAALRFAALIAVAAACAGFWLVGGILAKKWNPLLAVPACLGSWVMGGILMFCYAYLRYRIGGGTAILVLGGAVSLGVTPLLISSVYACSYFRSQAILLLHLLVGLCVLNFAQFAANTLVGQDRADAWWNEQIFQPAGLIAPLGVERRVDS